MLALTLIQPWAWAILHAGKRIENRGWRPPPRILGARIAIHAGKKREDDALLLFHGDIPPRELPSMAIVGTAVIVGIVTKSDNEWFVGPVGWELDDVRPLSEPIPCRGALNLWRLPPDIESQVLTQEAAHG